MLVGFFRALVFSPYYGLLVATSAIPVLVVSIAVLFALGMVGLIVPPILFLALFVFLSAIFAQNARYAASISGLQSMKDQPKVSRSVMGSLGATFLITMFGGAIVAGLLAVSQKAGVEGVSSALVERLLGTVKNTMQTPVSAEQALNIANVGSGYDFLALLAFSTFLITLLSMLVVPRATGLEKEFGRAYSAGLILTRLVIALPFCVAMTNLLVNLVLVIAQAVLSVASIELVTTIQTLLIVQLFVFSGMIFTFEAYLLQVGRKAGQAAEVRQREYERSDNRDIRALRMAWSRS